MNRRRYLTLAGALASGGLAGCSASAPWSSSTPRPDADHDVRLSNDAETTVSVEVRVVRVATEGTVSEDTYEVAPGSTTTVYNTEYAEPDGVEAFTVIASHDGRTERATIETSGCYGDALVFVESDGGLSVTYATC